MCVRMCKRVSLHADYELGRWGFYQTGNMWDKMYLLMLSGAFCTAVCSSALGLYYRFYGQTLAGRPEAQSLFALKARDVPRSVFSLFFFSMVCLVARRARGVASD